MSIRYLCKAKRTDNREWVEGNLVWSDDADEEYRAVIIPKTKSNMFLSSDEGDLGFETWYLVDPETLCQYTGLTDETKWEELSEKERQQFLSEWNYEKDRKNQKEDWSGKKIWENDIVSFIDMYSTENGYVEMDCVGQVKWCEEELCFYVTERLSAESWEVLQECMVIGNIFDDPELLKGGTE